MEKTEEVKKSSSIEYRSEKETEEEQQYPTAPNAEGWFYEDASQRALEIETRVDPATDDISKRIQLTRGRVAIMTELNKTQGAAAKKIAGKNPDMVLAAYIALGTKVTDKDGNPVKFVAEDLNEWKAKDTNRLEVAASQLNF